MNCPKCGASNDNNTDRCANCSTVIGPEAQAAALYAHTVPTEATALGGLIPYKNSSALTAYYLGVFSLVCGILSIPAVIFGIMGLKFALLHPELKGKAHAWVGIVLGGVTTLLYAVIITIVGISSLTK
jgi:hypothetical protein